MKTKMPCLPLLILPLCGSAPATHTVETLPAPSVHELQPPDNALLRYNQNADAFVALGKQDGGWVLQRWQPALQATPVRQKTLPLTPPDDDWWLEAVSADTRRVLVDTSRDSSRPYLLYDFDNDTLTTVEHNYALAGVPATFSPDGNWLAMASLQDGRIRVQVLDARDGKPATPLLAHGEDYKDDSGIQGLAALYFSHDSRRVISQGRSLVREWEVSSQVNTLTFVTGWEDQQAQNFVESAFHPDTNRLFSRLAWGLATTPANSPPADSTLAAKNCLLLDLDTQQGVFFSCDSHPVFRPNSTLTIFQDRPSQISAVDSSTGKAAPLPEWLVETSGGGQSILGDLKFTPDGNWLAYRQCEQPSTKCTWQVGGWASGKTYQLVLPEGDSADPGLQKFTFLAAQPEGGEAALPYPALLLRGDVLPSKAYLWK